MKAVNHTEKPSKKIYQSETQGPFDTNVTEVLGTDMDYFGKPIYAVKEQIAYDYIKHLVMNGFSLWDKVYVVSDKNGNIKAVNAKELPSNLKQKKSKQTKKQEE